uniref:Uncharacterized protein n=1 Tax=Chaetoceros debilis TaxID=122233 RepID=A0A7S3Q518_9STRA
MSQQAQSQQQNANYPNHLKDQEDLQQVPREDDHFCRRQRQHPLSNQRYMHMFQRDQISLTQSQSITRCREQQLEQQHTRTTDQNRQLFGWQEGHITQHVIDVQQRYIQTDASNREKDETSQVDQ